MSSFKTPLRAKAGPVGTQTLFNNHADRIDDLGDAIDRIAFAPGAGDNLRGEDTTFRAIKDAHFVGYIIKATLSDVFEDA